jgi:inhibitor of cysteine peptidase
MSVALTAQDRDRTVHLAPGEVVTIALAENATTGYRWAVDQYDDRVVDLLPSEYEPSGEPGSGPVGAGEAVRFSFRARAHGVTPVRLKHWRHWEGDASIIDRFSATIHVD